MDEENSNPLRKVYNYTRAVFYLTQNLMERLPKKLSKKWLKLTYPEFVLTKQDLCLRSFNDSCDGSELLVAKNYLHKSKSLIVINEKMWNELSESQKHSIIWHELMGIIEFEQNSYYYSSLVRFETECESNSVGSILVGQTCYTLAKIYDDGFEDK